MTREEPRKAHVTVTLDQAGRVKDITVGGHSIASAITDADLTAGGTVEDRWAAAAEAAVQVGSQQQYLYLRGQIDELRALVAEILGHFGPSGSGHTARVGQVQIAKWRQRAGIEAGQ